MCEYNGTWALKELNKILDLEWGKGRLHCKHGLERALKGELS